MLLNYLKLAVRLLIRDPFFTFINVLGLSVGFAMFFILWQHSSDELKSDQFHKDRDRIYRLYFDSYHRTGNDWVHYLSGTTPPVFTSIAKEKFTVIESATRIFHQNNFYRYLLENASAVWKLYYCDFRLSKNVLSISSHHYVVAMTFYPAKDGALTYAISRNQIAFFTFVAVGIACLGLFGMINSKAIGKIKEIGIRKALGAKLHHVFQVLLNSTIKQIQIASLPGIPLAYSLSLRYSNNFSGRISLQW